MAAEYEKKIAAYSSKLKKYEAERGVIKQDAEKYEKSRDDAQKHLQAFGIAVIFLQIAILLSSVAALMKKKSLWVIGVAVGAVGVVYFADGFLLFM